jgi:hypothetical protein
MNVADVGLATVKSLLILPSVPMGGHDEGHKCLDCGHESRYYVKSIWEEEAQSGSYELDLDKPIKF